MSGRPNTKWMESMIKKHGSREAVRAWVQSVGAKGGRKGKADGVTKGFALMSLEKRRAAGHKGGSKGIKDGVVKGWHSFTPDVKARISELRRQPRGGRKLSEKMTEPYYESIRRTLTRDIDTSQ